MRALGWLLLYLALVVVVGALLAPVVWNTAQALRAASPGSGLAAALDHPFPRYVHRCLLGTALLGLPLLGRVLHLRSWSSVGLGRGEWRRPLLHGAALTALAFALVVGAELALGLRDWRTGLTAGGLAAKAGEALLAAVVVAFLEELLFRGVVFRGLVPGLGVLGAVLVSSVLFAAVHDLGRAAPVAEVGWRSGFDSLAGLLAGRAEGAVRLASWWKLFSLGILLAGAARGSSTTLALPVGLHAGVVFWHKLRGGLTVGGAGWEDDRWRVLGSEFVSIAALWFLVLAVLRPRR